MNTSKQPPASVGPLLVLLVLCLMPGTFPQALAVSVLPAEMAEMQRFVAAKIKGEPPDTPATGGLRVLANHDPVQLNSRAGRPLRLGTREYTRGLYCHAHSRIIVSLPGPARGFTAMVGVDSNEQTSGGRGSVVFRVEAEGAELFKSPLLREDSPALSIDVELNGAREFVLEVSDGGDGISCDQVDWADAKVGLADGQELWLADLPLDGLHRPEFSPEPPFSFNYGGKPSAAFLANWVARRESRKLDTGPTEHAIIYTDPETGLQVRWVVKEYHDFPTVEWTLYFRNTGPAGSPVLDSIQALDLQLEGRQSGEFVLHHHVGSPCQPNDYAPLHTVLNQGQSKRISAAGGRPTNSDLPYFNLLLPGEGLIVVVGWPGQWSAEFARDGGNKLHLRAGQELTHFKLLPGEEVRSPLVVLQFHRGDRIRSQNLWRRWMLAHNYPRPGGKLPPVHLAACSSHQYAEMINADTASQIMFIDRYLAEGIKLDYWWMDAGWYVNQTGWPNTGTWEIDRQRFADGLRPVSDHAHSKGIRTILWFEPERVTPGTRLYEQHPQWLLGQDGQQKLLYLGDAQARQWLTDHVDRLMREEGIDLYRQDHNFDPLELWRANDAPDRQGITEIRHVEGYLAFWDELRQRNPGLLIDTCASGGRRNDLETLRRAIPLLRSDYILEPVGNQGHTYGIAFWMPCHGTGVNSLESYGFRSVMCPQMNACFDMRRTDLDYERARQLIAQWRQVADCYYGDYYPLTGYSLDSEVWMAWQFDLPEKGEGLVQCFRRADSPYESARFRLQGLHPQCEYEVIDLDGDRPMLTTGATLLEDGLLVTCHRRPAAKLITYRRR